MLELDSQSLVTIQRCHLYICGVVHMDGTKEVCGSKTLVKTKCILKMTDADSLKKCAYIQI